MKKNKIGSAIIAGVNNGIAGYDGNCSMNALREIYEIAKKRKIQPFEENDPLRDSMRKALQGQGVAVPEKPKFYIMMAPGDRTKKIFEDGKVTEEVEHG